MRSTSGAHFIALDHIRALAALLVFSWHFTHGQNGYPSPFEGSPSWGPLVFFDEGHVGVSLFMTLSGYLFAKLLDGKNIIYHLFLWNRVLRLFPLLVIVMLINASIKVFEENDIRAGYWFLLTLPKGLIQPTWLNGGWSITAELHFYLLLPFLLALRRWSVYYLVVVLFMAVAYRFYAFTKSGEIQTLAYFTIIGRIDQFLLGIIAFYLSKFLINKHLFIFLITLAFTTVYWQFDVHGGFYLLDGYPSTSKLWIVLPTIEGFLFACIIAWYDNSFSHSISGLSQIVGRIGEYSYSIYLLHFFVVFKLANFIHTRFIDISNFNVAFVVSLVAFSFMIPLAYLSMNFVEQPFLRLRKPYYVK